MHRVELKYNISGTLIKDIVNLYKLKKLYEDRNITSTYYDTEDFSFFNKSVEGIRPRIKIRIRNYNLVNTYYLELKKTKENGKIKISTKLKDFNEDKKSNINKILQVKDYTNEYLIPILTVNYTRKYFFNSYGRFTIDSNIVYKKKFNYRKYENLDLNFTNLLEFKSLDLNAQKKFNLISTLKEHSFSKYCQGVSNLYKIQI